MKLIVGLGNPGNAYAQTRHNAGFMLVDLLAVRLGARKEKKQGQALLQTAGTGADQVILAKPQSYMNLSGDPLWALLHYYKDGIEDFIIVHDDLDMPLGRLRFKNKGGTGGHKGLKSITERLGSDAYDRLKIGIGRPPEGMKTETYVLQRLSSDETAILDKVMHIGVEGILYWLKEGCIQAMNQYNATDKAAEEASNETSNETEDKAKGRSGI